ncbi:hypothetical protein EDC04DRAFT_2608009 [Pisolithus marmoratus]|nr:hypothetical protein EDC04DRAFT_2608009 [Pisolithus marmoratus]
MSVVEGHWSMSGSRRGGGANAALLPSEFEAKIIEAWVAAGGGGTGMQACCSEWGRGSSQTLVFGVKSPVHWLEQGEEGVCRIFGDTPVATAPTIRPTIRVVGMFGIEWVITLWWQCVEFRLLGFRGPSLGSTFMLGSTLGRERVELFNHQGTDEDSYKCLLQWSPTLTEAMGSVQRGSGEGVRFSLCTAPLYKPGPQISNREREVGGSLTEDRGGQSKTTEEGELNQYSYGRVTAECSRLIYSRCAIKVVQYQSIRTNIWGTVNFQGAEMSENFSQSMSTVNGGEGQDKEQISKRNGTDGMSLEHSPIANQKIG